MLRRCAVLFAALFMVVGLGACSDDGDSSQGATTPAGQDGGSSGGVDDAAAAAAALDAIEDNGRAFGVDQEQVVGVLVRSTKADSYKIDGDTIRLRYKDGSVEDSRAHINCSVAEMVGSEDDKFILEYPDGTLDCTTRNDS